MDARTGTPSAQRLLSHAVGELARRTRFPVAFGGFEHDGAVHVSSISGTRTPSIEGLVVEQNRGLGGRALVEKRPRLAVDYRTSRTITHDYDRAILGEGIATLFAVPVVVSGLARAVLYCGSWTSASVGDVVARPALHVAGDLATELRVREEVERRLVQDTAVLPAARVDPALREELRESYAELRSIAATVSDDAVRRRLAHLEDRLAALSGERSPAAGTGDIHLSPRETDVLACAALGSTNAEIAATLALRETTVKSYLASAMAKLDASTRHAAVTKARRCGLLP